MTLKKVVTKFNIKKETYNYIQKSKILLYRNIENKIKKVLKLYSTYYGMLSHNLSFYPTL